MKNKIAVLLMEAGVSYNKQKLHKVGYFRELLATNQDIDEGLRSLLQLCREMLVRLRRPKALWFGRWSVIRCCGNGSSG